MSATIDIGTLIQSTLGICGGRPRITGTRIPVYSIVMDYKAGMSNVGDFCLLHKSYLEQDKKHSGIIVVTNNTFAKKRP